MRASGALTPKVAVRLCGVVRKANDVQGRFAETITTENYADIAKRHEEPATPIEQMDRLLAYIADQSRFVGDRAELGRLDALARRIYLESYEDIGTLLDTLKLMGFTDQARLENHLEGGYCALTITGWERADRVRRTMRSGNQAFVAMWFHREMDPVFDNGIAPALRACGYTIPYRVDREAHQNRIDDEIIANLRKSRLMVADLTGIRPNVFYEAGFAMGLGIPVILTCSEDYMGHFVSPAPNAPEAPPVTPLSWFKQVSEHAFDVRQYPITRWADPAGLKKALKDRIEALGHDIKPSN